MTLRFTAERTRITTLGVDYAQDFPGYSSDADILAIGIGDSYHAAGEDAMEQVWQDHLWQSQDDWQEVVEELEKQVDRLTRTDALEVDEYWDGADGCAEPPQCYVAIEIWRKISVA